jgi:transcriptional regulator with XRE-family HTH domain
MEFGLWLKTELSRRSMTHAEFADRVGVSRAAVSRWVRGERLPDGESIFRIAEAFNLDPDTIMRLGGRRSHPPRQVHDVREEIADLQARRNLINAEMDRLRQQTEALDQRLEDAEERLRIRELSDFAAKGPTLDTVLQLIDTLSESSSVRDNFKDLLLRYYGPDEKKAFLHGVLLGQVAPKMIMNFSSDRSVNQQRDQRDDPQR